MKRFKSNAICLAFVTSMAGCAVYVPPTTGDIAKVTYRIGGTSGSARVYSFASRACDSRLMIGGTHKKLEGEDSPLTVDVQAGRDFVATTRFESYRGTCDTTSVFTPEKGGVYQVLLQADWQAGTCRSVVTKWDAARSEFLLAPPVKPQSCALF